MVAPKSMNGSGGDAKQVSGLRKLFSRKNSHKLHAARDLKVASPPPNVRSFPSKQTSSSSKKRGFFSRKRTPSLPIEPSSGSSSSSEADVEVLKQTSAHGGSSSNHQPKFVDLSLLEQRQQPSSSHQQQHEEVHIRSIRPMNNNDYESSLLSPEQLPRLQPVREHTRSGDSKSHKQIQKERDGFCRRVDNYDGSLITVDGQAAYELGHYLGGGVAGVVYEGHRLLPVTEYPVRTGCVELPKPTVIDVGGGGGGGGGGGIGGSNREAFDKRVNSLLSCVPSCLDAQQAAAELSEQQHHQQQQTNIARDMIRDDGSFLTMDSYHGGAGNETGSLCEEPPPDTVALEAVDHMVLIDAQDAPSRSKHMAKAVTDHTKNINSDLFPSDASFTGAGFMEETVAIKILNPVGFRTLAVDVTNQAVICRQGAPFAGGCMEEQHVWWLVNPQSRNLRTLQRYTIDAATPRGVQVDRGSADRGLRISLIAAYKDPADGHVKELPLTRCIEIWGHVPFEASDQEFRDVMSAIDQINQGLPPPVAFDVPGRVPTMSSGDGSLMAEANERLSQSVPMTSKRT